MAFIILSTKYKFIWSFCDLERLFKVIRGNSRLKCTFIKRQFGNFLLGFMQNNISKQYTARMVSQCLQELSF